MNDLLATFMPHAHCYGNDPLIFWAWVLGDVLTWAAYMVLPAVIWRAHATRPDLVPRWAAVGAVAFIGTCGIGHLLDALGQWLWPAYRLRAVWGLITAAASVGTATVAVRHASALDDVVSPTSVNAAADAIQAGDGEAALAALGVTPEGDTMRAIVTPRILRRILADSPVGVCRVDADGIIRHIEGGAVREVGANYNDFLGQALGKPWTELGFAPALEGRTVMFSTLEPVAREQDHVVMYAPAYNGRGEISGATVWWMLVPEGQSAEVLHG